MLLLRELEIIIARMLNFWIMRKKIKIRVKMRVLKLELSFLRSLINLRLLYYRYGLMGKIKKIQMVKLENFTMLLSFNCKKYFQRIKCKMLDNNLK